MTMITPQVVDRSVHDRLRRHDRRRRQARDGLGEDGRHRAVHDREVSVSPRGRRGSAQTGRPRRAAALPLEDRADRVHRLLGAPEVARRNRDRDRPADARTGRPGARRDALRVGRLEDDRAAPRRRPARHAGRSLLDELPGAGLRGAQRRGGLCPRRGRALRRAALALAHARPVLLSPDHEALAPDLRVHREAALRLLPRPRPAAAIRLRERGPGANAGRRTPVAVDPLRDRRRARAVRGRVRGLPPDGGPARPDQGRGPRDRDRPPRGLAADDRRRRDAVPRRQPSVLRGAHPARTSTACTCGTSRRSPTPRSSR